MRLGIDADGVLFDSEKEFRVYTELYDLLELKRNSKVNNAEMMFQDRFKWTPEEKNNFMKKYNKQIMEDSNFMPGAKEILKRLKQEGNTLILITARGKIEGEVEITEKRLRENDLDIFDKKYWKSGNKAEICKNENIDIMIDDYYKNCSEIAKEHIKAIYLKDAPSQNVEEDEYLKVLYNWGEIYRYIKGM